MSKYIDAERLKRIIDKRWKENIDTSEKFKKLEKVSAIYAASAKEAYDILAIIDSLQQEQPDVDLEEKIQDWCKENVTGVKPIYTADSLIYDLLPKTARHFYELGKARKGE